MNWPFELILCHKDSVATSKEASTATYGTTKAINCTAQTANHFK